MRRQSVNAECEASAKIQISHASSGTLRIIMRNDIRGGVEEDLQSI